MTEAQYLEDHHQIENSHLFEIINRLLELIKALSE